MNKTRDKPTRRLDDGFMKWCKLTVRENKPPRRTNLTSEKVLKGGEYNAEK